MSPPSDRKPNLPNLFDMEQRLRVVEREFVRWLPEKGAIMRELSQMKEKLQDVIEANKIRKEMDSSADISIRPGRVGIKLKALPAWAIVSVSLVTLVLIASVIALQLLK